MKVREKFESWLVRNEFNQDTFQSFICWTLLAGTILSGITPAILVFFQNTSNHCDDGTFTILAHYRIHPWLWEMFELFKLQLESEDDDKYKRVCFELLISDSTFKSSEKPAVWIPESLRWLEEAEQDSDIYGDTLVSDESTQCISSTLIPMGLVTWSNYSANLENPMDYADFLSYASMDNWGGRFGSDEASFSHAHPNVTSSGVLGMILGYQTQLNTTERFVFSEYTRAQIINLSQPIREIEKAIHELGPNELAGIATMLGHGPEYIHAMYGYENDVAYNNLLFKDLLESLWGDSLTFIYFTESYWMTHPVCVLDEGIAAYDDFTDRVFMKEIAYEFQEFLVSNSTRKEKLLEFGIRPYNVSKDVIDASSVLSEENGVDASVTPFNTVKLELPFYLTIEAIRREWQKMKEPAWIRVLIDISAAMQEEIEGQAIARWARASEGLTYFAEALEDTAVYEISCFSKNLVACGENWPNGTLGDTREDIVSFIEGGNIQQSAQFKISLYDSLNETLNALRMTKAANDAKNQFYNYAVVVVTQDESGSSHMTADELLQAVGINTEPDEVHVFPVRFWDTGDGETKSTLEKIATRTNGVFFETKQGTTDTFEEIGYYF